MNNKYNNDISNNQYVWLFNFNSLLRERKNKKKKHFILINFKEIFGFSLIYSKESRQSMAKQSIKMSCST